MPIIGSACVEIASASSAPAGATFGGLNRFPRLTPGATVQRPLCSDANLSTYCVTAHCEIVRMLGIEGPEPEQVELDHTITNIPINEKALLDFAVKQNNHPRDVSLRDIDALRGHGFGDEHILEATVMV